MNLRVWFFSFGSQGDFLFSVGAVGRFLLRVVIIFMGGVSGGRVWAQSSISAAHEVRPSYVGARALGMGGVQIAIVNDETALLTNPAGLGRLRDSFGTLIDPELEASSNVANTYWNKSISNFFAIDDVASALKLTPDQYYHAKAQFFPSLVTKNFGMGILAKYSLDEILTNSGALLPTLYQNDLGLYLGYNFRFFGGRIKLGFAMKMISRIEVDKDLDPAGDLTVANNGSEGLGVGYDVGLNLSAPWFLIPTLSIVARDLGGTAFTAGSLRANTVGRPTPLTQDYDVGLALFPIHGNQTRSSFSLEVRKVLAAQQAKDFVRYAHLGWELNLSDVVFFRLGTNGRYPTFGLELASERLQIQLATYGEEIGVDGTTGLLEDRRLVQKFAFRF